MTTKKSTKPYTVQFCVRAIVEVEISSDSLESALAYADSMVNNEKFFRDDVSYLDGSITVAGLNDMTQWSCVNE